MTTFEAFFGFTGAPFSRDVAVDHLLKTESSRELHGRLNYVARTRAFGVFTGDAGTGKTTAIRKFSQGLDANRYRVLYLSDSALTPRNFYWETLHELGYEPRFYRGDAKRQLQKALAVLTDDEKRTPVVIVDEAHLLSREMLEEIRFLLNLRMDSYSALSLVLVGQTELRETLKLQVNKAIWQRVDIRFHLTTLTREETAAYIRQTPLRGQGAGRNLYPGRHRGDPRILRGRPAKGEQGRHRLPDGSHGTKPEADR
jgi:general secretion pathway protein A